MKVDIVSHSDSLGGAARASLRLHKALRKIDVESSMIVKTSSTDELHVISSSRIIQILSRGLSYISTNIGKLQKTRSVILHSFNFVGSFVYKKISERNSDIVNLHWVNAETLSIKQIGKIKKPVVMTLHDMWAFCGSEHLSDDNDKSMFRKGYNSKNNDGDYIGGINLNSITWKRKKKYWTTPFIIVTPSTWLTQCVKESDLFSGWDVFTIPNALDTKKFKPLNKTFARNLMNIPQDKKIIGFGAMGGGADPNKGFDLLVDALNSLPDPEKYHCVVFGQSHASQGDTNINIDIEYVGHLYDESSLVAFYNSLDVMVVPSRQESLSQTATEAQSCGVPVVAFGTTGLNDVIEHQISGYLATPFNTNELAKGIEWCVSSDNNHCANSARKRALKFWDEEVVALQYREIFKSALNQTDDA